VIFR
jgi:hypothetical protein